MRKNTINIGVILLVLSLCSCGIYNKYQRPEVEVDGLFGEMTEEVDTLSSLADLKWNELFTDTVLQNLITRALEVNTDLNVARLKVEEAQASLTSAKLSASWKVDIWGKLTTAKRKERAVLEQSEAYRQAVQTQLIATVAESYTIHC